MFLVFLGIVYMLQSGVRPKLESLGPTACLHLIAVPCFCDDWDWPPRDIRFNIRMFMLELRMFILLQSTLVCCIVKCYTRFRFCSLIGYDVIWSELILHYMLQG